MDASIRDRPPNSVVFCLLERSLFLLAFPPYHKVSGRESVVGVVLPRTPSQHKYRSGRTPPTIKSTSPGRRIHSSSVFRSLDKNLSERASKYPTLTASYSCRTPNGKSVANA